MTRIPTRYAWLVVAFSGLPSFAAAQGDSLLLRPAGLSVESVSLEAALQELEARSGVRIAFSPTLLPHGRVSCPCQSLTVGEALARLLDQPGLRFEERGGQVAIRKSATPAPHPVTLHGVVADRVTGAAVPYVQVRLSSPARLTFSDALGQFRFSAVLPGTYELRVNRIGFAARTIAPVEVGPADSTAVDIVMDQLPQRLADLVVTPGEYRLGDVAGATLRTLTRDYLNAHPQLGDDPLRTAGALPGNAMDDVSAKLRVRGGTGEDLAIWFAGVRLLEPYHVKDFDGAFSIVDQEATAGATLLAGGFPVRFGDAVSGVFLLEPLVPAKAHGTFGISASNFTASGQGTFHAGRGSWLVAGRRGFLDLVLGLTGADKTISPTYYDAFARATYQLGVGHTLAVNGLLATDAFFFSDGSFRVNSDWMNGYAWATWTGTLTSRVSTEFTVSMGRITRSRVGGGREPGRRYPESLAVNDQRRYRFANLASHWTFELSRALSWYAGGSLQADRATYDYFNWTETVAATQGRLVSVFDTVSIAAQPNGSELGGYAGSRVRPWSHLVVDLGARLDAHSLIGERQLSPRAAATWLVTSAATIRSSAGRFCQAMGLHELNVVDDDAILPLPECATQIASGIEYRWNGNLSLSIEGYRRSLDNPRPSFVNLSRDLEVFPETEPDRVRLQPLRGRAQGIETVLRSIHGASSWSVSYTLASAEDLVDGRWVPRTYDQRHAVTLEFSVEPGHGWRLGSAWHIHSGWPVSEPTLRVDRLANGSRVFSKLYNGINNTRLPIYHRLDLRLSRVMKVKSGRLNLYLDVFNAYNRTNPRSYDFDVSLDGPGSLQRGTGQALLPILPTLGVRWEW